MTLQKEVQELETQRLIMLGAIYEMPDVEKAQITSAMDELKVLLNTFQPDVAVLALSIVMLDYTINTIKQP